MKFKRKSRAGEIKNFTGVANRKRFDEALRKARRATDLTAEEAADQVIAKLKEAGWLG